MVHIYDGARPIRAENKNEAEMTMPQGPLFQLIDTRVASDRDEGDIAYFNALTLELEYMTKLVTAVVVGAIGDDVDRHRYTLEHRLVRANSNGEWAEVLAAALTGPAAQFIDPNFRHVSRELTERVSGDDWRYKAVSKLGNVARHLDLEIELGAKASLRQYFELAVAIRNRTRAHGAETSAACARHCPYISESIEILQQNSEIFRLPWVHIRRNMSGKYKVSCLLGCC